MDQKIFDEVEAIAPEWAAIFDDFEHLRDEDLFQKTAIQLLASAPNAQARDLVHTAKNHRIEYYKDMEKYKDD